MTKLDSHSGLTKNQIDLIKFRIKQELRSHLPDLPPPLDEQLFLQGRHAWTYRWQLESQNTEKPSHPITVIVEAKLKREFATLPIAPLHAFRCTMTLEGVKTRPRIHVLPPPKT